MAFPQAASAPEARPPAPGFIVACTVLAYALAASLALLLISPAGYAAPLFPSAGIALAVVLCYGPVALPGVALGSLVVNIGLGAMRGNQGLALLAAPLLIAAGATVQAALGAALVRRYVTLPLALNGPRDVLLFCLLGAPLACLVNAGLATAALLAFGLLGSEAALTNAFTWWAGDTLGVLIAAPLVLTLIGLPREDWRPRRRTVGLPMLLALGLVAAGIFELSHLEHQRRQTAFERDADRLAGVAMTRLTLPLHALEALQSVAKVRVPMDQQTLEQSAQWWLSQAINLQAMGISDRVALDRLSAFEIQARADGHAGYTVFDLDDGAARAVDREVVALRYIAPLESNRAALGVNVLSIPAARAAILAARDSGEPRATAGFKLTQSRGDETGLVLYQALYRSPATDPEARRRLFRGVVFVTVDAAAAMAGLAAPGQQYLRWCLVDAMPGAARPRLAGTPGCEADLPSGLQAERKLEFGGREFLLQIGSSEFAVPGRQRETAWLLGLLGLSAAAMLGALLLTVTGHGRRTEMAVKAGTAELRREISVRGFTEAALRDSEQRLRSILDNAPIGVMFLDRRGRLIECNPHLATLLGRNADDLRGCSLAELLQPEEAPRLRAMRRDLVAGAENRMLDALRLRNGRGQELVVRVAATALRDPQGRLLRIVGVLEDITGQLRLQDSERALHRAEAASRAKSEFVSRMSHELRTPLNAMIGFAQLLGLDRDPALVARQRDWVQQIQRAGWHLLEMINETLDLARIESGDVRLNLAPVALQPLLATCNALVASLAAQHGIRMSEVIEPDACAVIADATRLKQVLTNLLSNAVKYNRDGGVLTVSTRRVVSAAGDRVEIAVADSGMGMTAEQMGQLFQPYNRLGREGSGIEGTGIGLTISRRLSELMGGTLEAASEAGKGTIFTLTLPAADAAEQPVVRYTDTSPAPYQGRLVHYVEDNETNIEVMRGIFAQRPQIRLEVSMLGLDGLAAIRATQPDLVLLDMQLPDISGLELLRHLKQDDSVAAIPVMVVSADATTRQTQNALTSGALHYVTKPLDVAGFLGLVDGILEDAQTRWG